MPCLNEARTLTGCIAKAQLFLEQYGVSGEVLVADNGSTDGSIELATGLNARVVGVPVRGYGAALAAGIAAAKGEYVIMGDSDESYDFSALAPFVAKLREGYDLVMGNRYRGGISPGAMPPMHRYFGNPLLTALGRLFFSCRSCGDFYCGLRGFRKEAIEKLALQSRGMEFALEMVIKSRDAWPSHHRGTNNPLTRWPRPGAAPAALSRRMEKSALLPFDESTMVFRLSRARSCSSAV